MKSFKIFLLTCTISFLLVGSVSAADLRDLTVYNNTGYTIRNLYIHALGSGDGWPVDLLGLSMLYSGEHTVIKYDASYQYYELRIYLTDGSYREWTGSSALNFYGSSMLVLTYLGDGRFNARVD